MVIKKTIILSNKSGKFSNSLALLCLQKTTTNTVADIKLYSMPKGQYTFGLCEGQKVLLKQPFEVGSTRHRFVIDTDFDLEGKVSAVIVDNSYDLALWGNYNFKDIIFDNVSFTQSVINNDVDLAPQIDKLERAESKLQEYMDTTQTMQDDDKAKLFETDQQEIDKQIDQQLETTFFDGIKDQIYSLFEHYPAEENLQKLIPHSKWVKVKYDDDSDEYVIGLIYVEEDLKYLAYGVPGSDDMTLSKEIQDYSVFVPTYVDGGQQKGYYVMYQDALSGQEINLSNSKNA